MKRITSQLALFAATVATVTAVAIPAAAAPSQCAACVMPPASAQATTKLDTRMRNALYQALADERGGVAQYGAIIKKFGEVRPFVNLVRAEERHAAALIAVMKRYEVPVPAASTETPKVPATLKEACEEGVELEKLNIQMYDGFLAWVQEADIRAMFTNLRDASLNNHLPALQNCAANGGRSGGGQGGRGPRGPGRGGR